jgi:hypothetical protein
MKATHACRVDDCGKPSKGFVCSMHRMRMSTTGTYDVPTRPTLEERFWSKVAPAGALDCWLWTGAHVPQGYGTFYVGGEERTRAAHRVAYELLRGEIPDGLHLDHLCRTPACVNPWHLEPVTPAENTRRQYIANDTGFCPQGHAFDEANTYRGEVHSGRLCRTCHRERERTRRGWTDPGRDKMAATHCQRGHAWTEENTYRRPDNGKRQCKACIRYRQELKAALRS